MQGTGTVRGNRIADKKLMSKSAAMHITYESNSVGILSHFFLFTDIVFQLQNKKLSLTVWLMS